MLYTIIKERVINMILNFNDGLTGDFKVDNAKNEVDKFLEMHDLVYPKIRKRNKVVIDGDIAYVYVRSEIHKDKYFIVDLKFLKIVERFVWHYKDGYAVATINQKKKRKTIRMNRLIMGVINTPDIEVDHINVNPYDNRECNLRLCIKGQDANNQSNIHLHFEFPEIVDEYILSKYNLYIMEVSDGLYNKIQIPYHSFEDLLKDKKFLYENGMNKGLPHILYNKQVQLFQCLETMEIDSIDYIVCTYFMNHIYKKVDEAKKRAGSNNSIDLLIENGVKKEDIVLDRPYFLQDGTIVIIPSGKSSKEKYKSKVFMCVESDIYRDLSFVEHELAGGFYES